jgi:hypothetical protein
MAEKSASEQIDDIIKQHGGWKGQVLSRVREVIKQADPAVVEEVKWKMPTRPEGLPVWSHDGILCMAETWKDNVKLIFTKCAQMDALAPHFNASLKRKTDRAIEFREGDDVSTVEAGLKQIVAEAVRLNELKAKKQ